MTDLESELRNERARPATDMRAKVFPNAIFAAAIEYDAIRGRRELDRLARAFADAQLRVTVAAEIPLERVANAHQRLERGHVLGRIGFQIHRRLR